MKYFNMVFIMYLDYAETIVQGADYYFGYWSDIRAHYYDCSGSESSLSSCNTHSINRRRCTAMYHAAGVRCTLGKLYLIMF